MKSKAYSLTGVISVFLTLPAAADVVYSNLKDIGIPADFGGVYLNVQSGASNTDLNNPQAGWHINPFFGGSVVWNSPTFQPVRGGTGNTDVMLNLPADTMVGSGSIFSTFVQDAGGENPGGPGYGASQTHLGAGPGQFTDGGEGYLGFRLNGTDYGWMRVAFTNNTGGAVIKEWAYENSGAAIAVGNIARNGATVTLNSAMGDFTVSSAIDNSGGTTQLVKSGVGVATLNGTNTYTGPTQVAVGRLNVGGSLHAGSEVTVEAGATLGGDSTIHGNVTLNGILRPGQGGVTDRTLNIGGTLTGTPGSSMVFNIAGENSHDQLVVGGSLDLTAIALEIESFTDSTVTELGMNQGLSFLTSGASLYQLIDGTTTGMFSNVTDKMTVGELAYLGLSGDQYTLNVGAQKFWVAPGSTYLVAIPEPATGLLGAVGLLCLIRRRRLEPAGAV
jgi:autotransporter-associated beta strand protein